MDNNKKELENKDLSKESILKNKSKYLIFGSIGLAVLILVSGSIYVYQKYYVNKGNSEIPSLQELKEKAAKKYEEIRGVSFQEENLVSTSLVNAAKSQQSFLGNNDAVSVDPQLKVLTEQTAKKISEKSINNSDVYYYELEVIANKTPDNNSVFPFYFGQSSLIDYTKPFTFKNWVSICSNKNVLIQNNKTINFSSYTNSSNTIYLGGKYAVKSIYNDAVSGFGCVGSGIFSNPDLEFVRAILNDNGVFKQVGTETINGVKTVIYEQNYSDIAPMISSVVDNKAQDSIASNSKIRYFVDTSKLQVVRTQYFDKDNLIYTQNLISSQKLSSTEGQKQIQSTNELNGTQIKEVKIDLTKQYNPETRISEAMKSFAILYLDKPNETVNYIYSTPDEPVDEYSKLTQTNDFDPSWEDNKKLIESNYVPSIGSYTGNSYSMIVYKSKPTQNSTGTTRTPKDILIDGKKVSAEIVKYDYSAIEKGGGSNAPAADTLIAPAPTNMGSVEFQYQNKWYALGFYGIKSGSTLDPSTEQVSLISMSKEKAQEIDTRNEFIKNSQPKVSYKNELKDISSESRYLPGDLNDKYKIEASYAIIDNSPNTKSTCTDLKKEERVFTEDLCLIDNFNGYEIIFNSSTKVETPLNPDLNGSEEMSNPGSSSPGFVGGIGANSLKYMVFKTSYAEIKPFLSQMTDYQEGISSDYKEVNGYTLIVEASVLNKTDRKAILDASSIDNGYTQINSQLQKNLFTPDTIRGL